MEKAVKTVYVIPYQEAYTVLVYLRIVINISHQKKDYLLVINQ